MILMFIYSYFRMASCLHQTMMRPTITTSQAFLLTHLRQIQAGKGRRKMKTMRKRRTKMIFQVHTEFVSSVKGKRVVNGEAVAIALSIITRCPLDSLEFQTLIIIIWITNNNRTCIQGKFKNWNCLLTMFACLKSIDSFICMSLICLQVSQISLDLWKVKKSCKILCT